MELDMRYEFMSSLSINSIFKNGKNFYLELGKICIFEKLFIEFVSQ